MTSFYCFALLVGIWTVRNSWW